MAELAPPRTGLSHGLCDADAERGVAVQGGDPDRRPRDLTVAVACHEPLARRFHAMHPGFDATSPVVSTLSSPERAAKVFQSAQGRVTGRTIHSISGVRLLTLDGSNFQRLPVDPEMDLAPGAPCLAVSHRDMPVEELAAMCNDFNTAPMTPAQ